MGQANSTRRRNQAVMMRTALLAGLVFGLAHLSAGGQEILKKSFVVSGDPKPILLNADYITTWTEAGKRIFLLRSNVWIEQGLVKLSMPESVVWVDEDKKKSTGIYNLQVYGEGNVVIKDRALESTGGRVLLEMATRGEVRIKARVSQVMQLALPQDPVFLKGKGEVMAAQPAAILPVTAPVDPTNGPGPIGPPPKPPDSPLWHVPVGPPTPGPANNKDAVGPPPSLTPPPTVANPPPLTPPPLANPPAPVANPPPTGQSGNSGLTKTGYQTTSGSPDLSTEVVRTGFQEPAPGPGSPPAVPPVPIPGPPPSVGPPPAPPPGNASGVPLPPPKLPPPQPVPARQVNISPRTGLPFQVKRIPLANGEFATVITNGVILTVHNPNPKVKLVDIEADRLVFWTKDDGQDVFNSMRTPGGATKGVKSLEFYMSGNVEIRNEAKKETRTIRADEVYYDVSRNVAVALRGEMEIRQKKVPYPLHIEADQIIQVNPKLFEMGRTVISASDLPSDPGLKVIVSKSTVEELDTPRRNIFGLPIINQKTGEPITDPQRIFKGRNLIMELEDIPVLYFPYFQGDPLDPLGPLNNLSFNFNKIFGYQFTAVLNVYDMLGLTPTPGTKWRLQFDENTRRGPDMATEYDFAGRDLFFGLPGRYEGYVKAFGIVDQAFDVLGGDRGQLITVTPPPASLNLPVSHPEERGRFQSRLNILEMPDGFTLQAQLNAISDINFMEEYYNGEFQNDPLQKTYAYLMQQQNNFEWSVLAQDRINRWYTDTSWLPKGDAYWIGQKLLNNWLTWDTHLSAGYGRLQPTDVPPPAYLPTDANVNTPRVDAWQTVSLPFSLGDFKLVPFGLLDLAYYGDNINKADTGRILGGGGIRASLPLSRYFPDVQSDYFNVNGIFHKIVFSANYTNLFSSVAMTSLPQMDRLNDDASDQALRQMFPLQFALNPVNAANLTTSNEFNPQFYALRRLLQTNVDTMDSIEVIQTDIRQRWQTLRGFPGNQHVVDWMTLDLGASIYPRANRDNFGQTFGILQYNWTWNVGDSTSLVSSGWMDPIGDGPRVFNFGANLSRPDRTNFYIGYRQIDPLQSKAVIANVTYAFSAKYGLTASTLYDFGINSQVNSVALTRIGTDVMVSMGFSYNSILNNFGIMFTIVPNIMAAAMQPAAGAMGGGPIPGGGVPFAPMAAPVN